MGGGLMQLVAYGAQDIYLTGNPQITFFKVVYRRHTNFSMESIQQTLSGSTTASNGATATCTISRNGDLVYKVYVTAPVISDFKGGSSLLKEVELEIGGQKIDRHYQEWNDVWNELTTTESKGIGLKDMQCEIGVGGVDAVTDLQLPLNFWFCRNPGLALPLIALQYHEVKIKFTWGVTTSLVPKVWCDYIYLDTDERRRFAQVSHEYLIEQVDKADKTISSTSISEKLNFNHPVKELIWTYDPMLNLTDGKLILNGHDRFSPQTEEYFNLRQPFDYHTAIPKQNLSAAAVEKIGATATQQRFPGGPSSGLYDGDDDGTAIGKLFVDSTNVKFKGDGDPGFKSTYAGGFDLCIEVHTAPVAKGTGGRKMPKKGEKYFVRVAADAANVDVTSNAVSFVTAELPSHNHRRNTLPITTATGGKYRIYESTAVDIMSEQSEARTSKMRRKIGVYSFSLKPEEHQPSGTCNFSRIDNAKLEFTSSDDSPTDSALRIYAVNYNVLRIMSGMGGLAYSN